VIGAWKKHLDQSDDISQLQMFVIVFVDLAKLGLIHSRNEDTHTHRNSKDPMNIPNNVLLQK